MSNDDLLRQIADRHIRAADSAEALVKESNDNLFIMLANRLSVTSEGIINIDDMHCGTKNQDELLRGDGIKTLGKRIFLRWSQTFQQFVCAPTSNDQALRNQIKSVITNRSGGAAAIIAGSLVAAFGVSPPIAAVIAALLLNLIVVPAGKVVCDVWKEENSKFAKEFNLND